MTDTKRPMHSHLELVSLHLELERLFWSVTLPKVSARKERPSEGNMKATSTSASKPILSASKRDEASYKCQRAKKPQVEFGPTPGYEKDSIATALQTVITDGGKQLISNALVAIPNLLHEVAEQFF